MTASSRARNAAARWPAAPVNALGGAVASPPPEAAAAAKRSRRNNDDATDDDDVVGAMEDRLDCEGGNSFEGVGGARRDKRMPLRGTEAVGTGGVGGGG